MRTKPRQGWLAGLLQGLVVLAILAGAGWIALDWALFPWIYLVGGKHRILPMWSGVGVAAAPSGRYHIYVSFFPTNNGSHMFPGVSVRGTGYICAPDGTRYSAIVRGSAGGRIWSRMDGHAFRLDVYHRPIGWELTNSRDWRPSLSFHGAWSGPDLRMADDGSIGSAFLPDGSLNSRSPSGHDKTRAVPVTFVETSWWLPKACPKAGS